MSALVKQYKDLSIKLKDGLRVITLNRPRKKNAISLQMYVDITAALKDAAEDDHTVITALTGAGDYYSSGNDLSSFSEFLDLGTDLHSAVKKSSSNLRNFVASFIDFPKILVAVVNGPAIGISVTTLALCDVVIAVDRATFSTPFVSLGQTAEGCSSYIFPRIMGQSLASEVLLMNRQLSAGEALQCGLVSRVATNLDTQVWPQLHKFALEMNPLPAMYTKQLMRRWSKEHLHLVNKAECERLEERWVSEDCHKAVINFFSRKNKL